MSKTFLRVSFNEKDRVKVLGARWDPEAVQWYVPAGLALTAFGEWLPADSSTTRDIALPRSHEIASVQQTDKKGVSLSQLLAGVTKAVADAFAKGVWTRVEVVNVHIKTGNVYLELTERDSDGHVLAKAGGIIWSRTAAQILPIFQRRTGAQLAAGIKLMVLAKPTFKALYSVSLEISKIDASYTLGDLEAHKRAIRERLKTEGVFEANRHLPAPWDYRRVLVIAPENAAGLGDFASEADRLHKHQVCEFIYRHSRFQGEGAATAIVQALRAGLLANPRDLDAVIIIRGGGAVNDLAWLNDYELANFVCCSKIPFLTGIGHERDSTVLDEVAHRKFDTPSKVIAGIENHIAQRARDATDAYEQVISIGLLSAERSRLQCDRLDSGIRTAALSTVSEARLGSESMMSQVQLAALGQLHIGRSSGVTLIHQVKETATDLLHAAKLEVPAAMNTVTELSVAAIRSSRSAVNALLPAVLDQIQSKLSRAHRDVVMTKQSVFDGVKQVTQTATHKTTALMMEVAGQGPDKTLARGFAMIRDSAGKTVTSADSAQSAINIVLQFHDGSVKADIRTQLNSGAKK